MINQELDGFIEAALECSVYIRPFDPGLSYDEIRTVCRSVDYLDGEINDALKRAPGSYVGTRRMPSTQHWVFLFPEEPEYRNFTAFDFVFSELNLLVRSEGAAKAAINKGVLIERAVTKGISRHDIQLAITWFVLSGQVVEKDSVLRFASANIHGLPSAQVKMHPRPHPKPHRARAYPLVKDIIDRRIDGRPKYAEPLDAFADELDNLGYKPFRMWWTQTVTELRRTDPIVSPLSASVLAAALVEGALTFIVKHARTVGLFQSKDYEQDTRSWRIDGLVASAASGGPSAVLDPQAKARAEALVRTRQRIHAGRMLSEHPGGPPDIRPDEARSAKETAEQVVRAILDWLQKNPSVPASPP